MIAIDKLLNTGLFAKRALKLAATRAANLFTGSSRKSQIVSASALFLAVCAFGAAGVAPMAPDASELPVKSLVMELDLPSLAEQIATLEPVPQNYISEEKVRSGDTLATVLQRLGVNDEAAANFLRTDKTARNVLQLKPGKKIQVQTAANGELQWLSAMIAGGRDSPMKNIVVKRSGDTFKALETSASLEKRVEMRSGEIRSSLFAATDAAQIPDAVATQIVDMFSTDIDFASDLRRGDRFNVVFETFWQDGEFIRAGRILAAEFQNANRTYQSVWFDESGSKQGGGYYGFDGKSLKKAFLKSPLEFSRISSGFSMRVHPISGQWKRHKGVDFAAATGTPIRAAGDGEIEFVGGQNGYGNTVVIKHWANYSTAYAHMNRFADGLRKGSKVRQGDVIGYVGSTGWSTGPHLHYEFRVDNEPRDPMAIDIPNAQPLAGAELQRFRALANDMTHRFALLSPPDRNISLASK
ncbi:MAG: family metallopeptidase [Herminiimonas sp.]|nr:family metallopeptidase [Herminiimonas sp.]